MSRHLKFLQLLILLAMPGCFHLENETDSSVTKTPGTEKEDVKVFSPSEYIDPVTPGLEEVIPEWEELEQVMDLTDTATSSVSATEPSESKPKPPYRLNLGDIIEISVLDEPEMTRDVSVIPDGTITYLLVGEIEAEGLTIADLRKSLTISLEEFFISPYISIITKKINIPAEEEKRVSILGAIKNSGNFTWHKGDRVLDLIAEAGGLLYTQTELGSRTTANLKASYLSRNGKEIGVNFYDLLRLGDMNHNILISPDDFIYIADSEESTIIVMGEVNEPRIIPYTRDMTVVEALSICGGFSREAYQSRVVILRSKEGETQYVEVDVNDILHGKNVTNMMLEGGDIVYIPEQTLSEYARWAGFLGTLADLLLKGYEVREAIRFPKLNRHSPSD